jgi:adenylate cyclase
MNLAARLEGANKEFGTLIMIGPGTYAAVRHAVEARELDSVRVAGKTIAVTVYELVCLKGQLSKDKAHLLTLYAEGLALYRDRKFNEAVAVLQTALQVDPADGPSQRLHAMCLELFHTAPTQDWQPISELSK